MALTKSKVSKLTKAQLIELAAEHNINIDPNENKGPILDKVLEFLTKAGLIVEGAKAIVNGIKDIIAKVKSAKTKKEVKELAGTDMRLPVLNAVRKKLTELN